MSLEDQLHDYFKEYDDKGFVIAINGEWGIGKTEFWKRFIEEKCKEERDNAVHWPKVGPHNFYINKPYAYVSLFGVDSLSALKIQIATSLSGDFSKNTKAYMSQKIKKGLLFLKELRGTYDGLSLTSPRLVEEMIFYGVKDAIICLDDFERLSKNLDIKDVMGLINFLKVENNCQIVLIMHDDQLKDDAYKGYKEKVFDEQLTIHSVLPLLQGMLYKNDRYKEIFLKFYECLGVNNFRFYKKVERLHLRFERYITCPIPENLSSYFLERIFEGVFISDFPDFKYNWDTKGKYRYVDKKYELSVDEELSKATEDKIINFSPRLAAHSVWDMAFYKWFNFGDVNSAELCKLIEDHNFSERLNKYSADIGNLLKRYYSFDVDDNYPEFLYEKSIEYISIYNLHFLSEACKKLDILNRAELSSRLYTKVVSEIESIILNDESSVIFAMTSFHYSNDNKFYFLLKKYIEGEPVSEKIDLIAAVKAYVVDKAMSIKHQSDIALSTKKDWYEVIFSSDKQQFTTSKAVWLHGFLNVQSIDPDKMNQIKTWVIEILEDQYPNGGLFESYRKDILKYILE